MIAILKAIWRWIMRIFDIGVQLEPEDAGLRFTVTKTGGVAAVGATVTCGTLSGTTGADGKVTLSPFVPGKYDWSVSLADYKTKTGTYTVV